VEKPGERSPFLEAPASTWVSHNEHAFAIHDSYPVSPGHTLVIPKRHVARWDQCDAAERAAIVDLVDAVKRILHEHYHPDGFNVGYNEGAAAGQTVFHLHIHVIPRYVGDVPDPRGGIRHAVMGKGNWQDPHE
jgi:diadenosine tetraphosphate (Ap4A) HIT family hydrolase